MKRTIKRTPICLSWATERLTALFRDVWNTGVNRFEEERHHFSCRHVERASTHLVHNSELKDIFELLIETEGLIIVLMCHLERGDKLKKEDPALKYSKFSYSEIFELYCKEYLERENTEWKCLGFWSLIRLLWYDRGRTSNLIKWKKNMGICASTAGSSLWWRTSVLCEVSHQLKQKEL